jgi:hypothetical protein
VYFPSPSLVPPQEQLTASLPESSFRYRKFPAASLDISLPIPSNKKTSSEVNVEFPYASFFRVVTAEWEYKKCKT